MARPYQVKLEGSTFNFKLSYCKTVNRFFPFLTERLLFFLQSLSFEDGPHSGEQRRNTAAILKTKTFPLYQEQPVRISCLDICEVLAPESELKMVWNNENYLTCKKGIKNKPTRHWSFNLTSPSDTSDGLP